MASPPASASSLLWGLLRWHCAIDSAVPRWEQLPGDEAPKPDRSCARLPI